MARYEQSTESIFLVLNEDGSAVSPEASLPISMGLGSFVLDITQAPNGNIIEIRYAENEIYHRPVEETTTNLKTYCFPHRGGTSGGNLLSIYGVNFNKNGRNLIVTVGGVKCVSLPATTSDRIDCIVPGGVCTVDVVVTNGSQSSTFEQGYRYVSGVLPPDFVLPEYTG
jgi:IPT/TIG domain